MKIEKSGSGVRYEGAHCRLAIERPGPGVAVLKIAGRDVGEFGAAPMRELERDLAAGPVELYVDAREVRGASLDVSNDWAQWLGRNRGGLRRVTMLTSSWLVQITADFVRRFAGLDDLMRVTTDPAVFDAALAASVASKKS